MGDYKGTMKSLLRVLCWVVLERPTTLFANRFLYTTIVGDMIACPKVSSSLGIILKHHTDNCTLVFNCKSGIKAALDLCILDEILGGPPRVYKEEAHLRDVFHMHCGNHHIEQFRDWAVKP